MTYDMIDLFAGAGGLTLGFVQAGRRRIRPVVAIDNDRAATMTYAAQFGAHALAVDIEQWAAEEDIPKADIVVGGPPCQGFSLLNKRRVGDARRRLWEPFLDTVERSFASCFVMENVPGLLKSDELVHIRSRADELGFDTLADVLNAADYGAPQTRKRTVVLGWKRSGAGAMRLPKPTHAKPGTDADGLLPWVTVRDVIADLPAKPVGTELGKVAPLDLHFGRNPTEISKRRYRAVPEGGNRFDLQSHAPEITPACWIRKTSGGTDLFGRLWWDRPSVTIRTEFFKPEKGRYLHPTAHRPITHREAARLMGFPDDFKFRGSKIEIARQIGNAVPPALAHAVALQVLCWLDRQKVAKSVRDEKIVEQIRREHAETAAGAQ